MSNEMRIILHMVLFVVLILVVLFGAHYAVPFFLSLVFG